MYQGGGGKESKNHIYLEFPATRHVVINLKKGVKNMKHIKRILLVVLVCALAIPIALPKPALAHSGISTFLTMTAAQVGDNAFELTILEYNDSPYWKDDPDLRDVWIDLQPLGYMLIKGDSYYAGGDLDDDGLLDGAHTQTDVGETWEWKVPVTVTEETTFVAIGHGITYDGWDITYNLDIPSGAKIAHDAEERAQVTVTPSGGGGEGFTPGFWRQWLEYWPATGYSPSDYFDVVFGVGPHIPLGGVHKEGAIWANGGGENALLRHATAALLNAAHPNVDFAFTVDEVIGMVQDAYATGDFNTAKDILATQNELEGDITS
jgi:hypothetical protein